MRARLLRGLSGQIQLAVLDVDMERPWKVLLKFLYALLERVGRQSKVRLYILPDMIVLNAPSEETESKYVKVSTCLVYELNVIVLAKLPPKGALENVQLSFMPSVRTRHRNP